MNKMKNEDLESLVKNLFEQSRRKPGKSEKERLTSILSRGLHELALRDLLILSSHLIFAMATILILVLKPFQNTH